MDDNMKKSYEKVRTFADDILQQCQEKGLTISEVQFLPNALSRAVESSIEEIHESELFFKKA